MFGYHGFIARIDLTTRTFTRESFDEDYARKYLGINGFAAEIINRTVPSDTAPFSRKNSLVMGTGPFTGSGIPGSGRGHMAAISPLTGFFFDSNFGGDFAWKLKQTGYDIVVIEGSSQKPVLIVIDNGEITFVDGEPLWGTTTTGAQNRITELLGEGFETALIGPAGENMVLYGAILCSGRRPSTAGRGGLGSVLGSKMCKGIAVRGDKTFPLADAPMLKGLIADIRRPLKESSASLTSTGTPLLVDKLNSMGKLVTRNLTKETWDRAESINGETIKKSYPHKKSACKSCSVACSMNLTVSSPEGEVIVKMPEFETLYSMGSMLENDDLDSVVLTNYACDELGMDTISFGVTVSFLTECVEKGLFTGPDSDLLRFSPGKSLIEVARKAAYREGDLGELLAMGSLRASRFIGKGSEKFLYQTKGLEMAGHSARGIRHMGLGYAVSTRGGSHHDARPVYLNDEPQSDPGFIGVVEKVRQQQMHTALGDSLGLCRFIQERVFGMAVVDRYLPFIEAVTGWQMPLDELREIAQRIYTLERYINTNRGLTREYDTLPFRVTHEPVPAGPSQGYYITEEELDNQLSAYYFHQGWDQRGIPTAETLERLGLLTSPQQKDPCHRTAG